MPSVPQGPASPGGSPSGNPGAAADSMSKVGQAIQILELALPGLPVGSDPHKAVLSAIQGLSKQVPPSSTVPGVQNTQLMALQKDAGQSAMLQQLARAMGQGPSVEDVQPSGAGA